MLITTGTCSVPINFKQKDTVAAKFGELGKITANVNL